MPVTRRVAAVLAGIAAAAIAVAGITAVSGQRQPIPSPAGVVEASTRAADGEPAVRLAVAGDVGTGDDQERRTAAAAVARAGGRGWDALVLLGDNIYEDGDAARARSTVLDPFQGVLQPGVPLLAALGNHDADSGNGPAQLDALGQPGPWFARRFGPLLLVVLDSNRPDDPEQLAWLKLTLAENDATWTVAAMHHPMRSAGYHGSDEEVRRAFAPLFKKFGVQLALAGHDHDYQRSRVIDGTTYVVSGAAAKLRPASSNGDTVVSQSVRHFLDLSVYKDRLVVQAVDQSGSLIDGVVIPAN
jgi:3',5'-cyclic AMP phosphodiesterase CpdA